MSHYYRRRDGSQFVIDVDVDYDKLARYMAETLVRKGTKTTTIAGGAIVARVNEK